MDIPDNAGGCRVETTPVAIQTALKRIKDEYVDAPKHRKLVILDHVWQSHGLAFVLLGERRRVVGQRGQDDDFHYNFEHEVAALDAQCGSEDVGSTKQQAIIPAPVINQRQQQ